MEVLLAIFIVTILHSNIWIGETKTFKEYKVKSDIGGFVFQSNVQEYLQNVENVEADLTGAGKYFEGINKQGVSNVLLSHIKTTENAPQSSVFQHSKYIGTISENEPTGTLVKIIGHVSVNCVENGPPLYTIESATDFFKLGTVYFADNHNNVLVSEEEFDREKTDLFIVRIKAQCSNGLTAETEVEVHVLDKNDNIPTFNESTITVLASSDQSWGKIATFTAYDGDQNDHIIYTMEGSSEFVLEPDTGDLYAESDYLFQGSHDLRVYASDNAGHISKPLSVHIVVENDVLKFKSFQSPHVHHLSKRATTTIARSYDIVENSTTVSQLFSVASVQPRPMAERYKLVSASVDMFLSPNNDGSVYLKPGLKLDYEDENQREILVIFNRTNLNTPEGMYLCNLSFRTVFMLYFVLLNFCSYLNSS